jgi:aminoglycoside phosphotransferase (APT) family kinase protein
MTTGKKRNAHADQVTAFLRGWFGLPVWELSLPPGSGNETYFARGGEQVLFVKVGARVENYRALAQLGLPPPLLAEGRLADGTPLLVQARVPGRKPGRMDFQHNLSRFAAIVGAVHRSAELLRVLPPVPSPGYRELGLAALARVRRKWERHRPALPDAARFVDDSLAWLAVVIAGFSGGGCVAGHNDICNANWLMADGGQIYLIDLEAMACEDPALDLGALLWWYYPPALRAEFLAIADPTPTSAEERAIRMRVRMALHCLDILLPREDSFDQFDPHGFAERLVDFRAVLAGEENPQGYAG